MAITLPSHISLPSPLTTAILLLTTTYLALYYLQTLKKHPSEPPIVPSRIPFLGPLIGLLLYGSAHGKRIGTANRHHRIFTLPLPGGKRIYTVTDPVLAAAVQRASRSLDFTPLLPDITERVFGLDAETMRVVRRGVGEAAGGEKGYLGEIRDLVEGYFSINAPSLGEFGLQTAREFAAQLSARADKLREGDGEVVDLLAWSRHLVIEGTARVTYGPENPLALDPKLEDAFWIFAHGIPSLLLGSGPLVGLVPGAGKTLAAREALIKGLREYLAEGREQKGGSEIVKRRVEVAARHGWPGPDAVARQELSFLFAMVINAAVTVFWVVLRVFADKELLKEIRTEVNGCVVATGGGGRVAQLSLERIKTSTPTLLAVFRESLRTGSDNVSTRIVTANTMLADQYFLAADSVVQVNGGVIHGDQTIWGTDASEFNHRRFLKTVEKSSVHPAAFRGFGGGKTMCPARHYATSEVLAIVAMVVLLFDVESVDGGSIKVPSKDDSVFPIHILEPRKEDRPKVRIRSRPGITLKRVAVVAEGSNVSVHPGSLPKP